MYLDFAADDAAFGGYIRLEGSSFWAAVVGFGGHPLVALRDDDVPRSRGLDVRTDGLWASLTCETPGEHWSAGMEAFAVGYDDPVDALGDERGDIVALGLDLEWERVRGEAGRRAGEVSSPPPDGLWHVHGDVLVGDSRIVIDTVGTVGEAAVTGRVGQSAVFTDDVIAIVSPDGLLAGGVASVGDVRVQLEPRWHAPVKSGAGLPRALCALTSADHGPGVAWASARPAVT